ncbi:MAG: DUF4974 domain-containing protein [Bacteroidota bacterium]|nr:DUF4974 domain-containing protein [Bacteroidota bacterium]
MKDHLDYLFHKFIDNACTDEELDELFAHFGDTDAEALKKHILAQLEMADDDQLPDAGEAERLANVHQLIKEQMKPQRSNFKRLVYRLCAAAAVIVVFVGLGINVFRHQTKNKTTIAVLKPITPGQKQATLTLANGQKIVLTSSMSGTLAQQGNTSVLINKNTGITYAVNKNAQQSEVSYNTLSTARGEQSPYPLILPDGSKVWLNAASSITFPTVFTGDSRVVKVLGEAYFEVVHNARFPFKVVTDKVEIKDLGTHFNVKSYSDEVNIRTTLLEGSVKVSNLITGKSSLLIPGQQSSFNKASNESVVLTANLEQVMSWKNGYFIFDNQTIAGIMKSMSRWYDVEVEYNNFSNEKERFGGTFSRSSNLTEILTNLERLGKVHFKLDKRKIIVSN